MHDINFLNQGLQSMRVITQNIDVLKLYNCEIKNIHFPNPSTEISNRYDMKNLLHKTGVP